MTGAQMIESFLVYYDRVTSFSAPGYTEDEILLFLNNAQLDFVKDRVFGTNFQPPALDDNQKRVADLSPLMYVVEDTTQANIIRNTAYGNSWFFGKDFSGTDAEKRVLYTINMYVRLTRTNPTITNEYVRCDRIKTEHANRFVSNAINRTYFTNPVYIELHQGYYIIADYYVPYNPPSQYGITGVKIDCIRTPYPIEATTLEFENTVYSSERMSLPSSVHQEIVDMAVRQALQALQDPRWQSSVTENNIKNS